MASPPPARDASPSADDALDVPPPTVAAAEVHHDANPVGGDPMPLDPSPTVTAGATDESPSRPPPLSRTSTLGKKCWICMSDASEDDPNSPPIWRSPCRCSLTAHEACLLDWIADLESPKNTKHRTGSPITCPQCKAEIRVARSQSRVLYTYRAVDRALGRLVLPGLAASLLGTISAGAWVHGFYSVFVVFGEDEAQRIFVDVCQHPLRHAAYAFIPLNLIFARTHYADFVLPGSTLFLLSTQLGDDFEIDMTLWPPLPSTVFACLPAVRSLYNWCYHQVFCGLNQKWLEEAQPTFAQPDHAPEGVGDADEEEHADDEAPPPAVDPEDDGAPGLILELNLNAGAADDPAEAGAEPANGQVHNILGERGDIILEGSSGIGQNILGALAFPAIAAGMGNLLQYALPRSWVASPSRAVVRPGMLQTKWGRSVIGGCLFVVLKDAFVLYCRWRLAQEHRSRRIMNYNKKTKEYSL